MLLGWRAATWLFGLLAASSITGNEVYPPVDLPDFFARASLQGEALWHIWIAQNGYDAAPHGPDSAAFLPLYPALIALVHRLGPSWPLAGGLVTHGALAAALAYLFALARLDGDRDRGLLTIAATLLWPAAPFLGVVYPEALLLLTIAAALYHARRGRWWAAALWGALAGLTRGFGVLLALPLLIEWLGRDHRDTDTPRRRLGGALAITAPPLGFLTFLVVLTLQRGAPLAYFRAQEALAPGSLFGALGLRTLRDLPAILRNDTPLVRGFSLVQLPFPTPLIPALIDATALLIAALAGVVLLRSRRSYGFFVLAGVAAIALLDGLPGSPRHLLGLAPLYLALGDGARHPVLGYLAATLGLALVALTLLLYVNGFWVG